MENTKIQKQPKGQNIKKHIELEKRATMGRTVNKDKARVINSKIKQEILPSN